MRLQKCSKNKIKMITYGPHIAISIPKYDSGEDEIELKFKCLL